MSSGIVFDIQRFALNDGPGVRTTVFLKGCFLRCIWCHNPESQAFEPQLSYRRERCDGTCRSVEKCASSAHRNVDDPLDVVPGVAASDHTCVSACHHDALSVVGRTMTVDQVLAEVERDRRYYERSGGGITLSGGEPLGQADFATDLLRRSKSRGLHTCLDTSGLVSRRRLVAAAPFVDLFYFDYKASDPDVHRRLTGASNERIVSNLEYLHELGHRIVLRCPMIPGVNDSADHLRGIAELVERLPRIEAVHVLPYHRMGSDKAERVGMRYALPDLPTTSDAKRSEWLESLHALGCGRAQLA